MTRRAPSDWDRLALFEMPPELASVRPSALDPSVLYDLHEALHGVALDWLRSPDCDPAIRGFGFGVRWANGQPTNEPVFQVFAGAAARRTWGAGPAGVIPPEFSSLVTLEVVRAARESGADAGAEAPVDLDDTGEVVPLMVPVDAAQLRVRQRPLQGGCSLGHPDVTGGTLGVRVVENVRGAPEGAAVYLLSNCHVLAADPSRPRRGDPTIQPAAVDFGARDRDVIGHLADFEPLRVGFTNRMDAALCALDDPSVAADGVAGLGGLRYWRAQRDTPIGLRVAKLGRTTGLTFGVVRSVGVTYKIDYKLGEPLVFSEQILTTHLAGGGDSGSLLVALGERPSVAGLILGGSKDVTLATPIELIQDRFGVLAAPEPWRA